MPRKLLTAEERQERAEKNAERTREISKYLKEAYIACLNGADPNDFPYNGWKYSNAVEAHKARLEQRRRSQAKRTAKRRALKEQKEHEVQNQEQTQN